jgi:hypothetical protein
MSLSNTQAQQRGPCHHSSHVTQLVAAFQTGCQCKGLTAGIMFAHDRTGNLTDPVAAGARAAGDGADTAADTFTVAVREPPAKPFML